MSILVRMDVANDRNLQKILNTKAGEIVSTSSTLTIQKIEKNTFPFLLKFYGKFLRLHLYYNDPKNTHVIFF